MTVWNISRGVLQLDIQVFWDVILCHWRVDPDLRIVVPSFKMLGSACPSQHSVTSQNTWSSALMLWECSISRVSHLLPRKFKVCWNLQILCWLWPDALQDLSCIHAPFYLLAVVTLALWAFTHVSVLCGQLLCFFRDHDDFLASKAATSPIIIFKARCEKAEDYTKRKHVFRWCVWIVRLLAVCPSIKSGCFHLLQHLMWVSDNHCYCVDCAMHQAVSWSLACPQGTLSWIPGQAMWDILWTKWHCDMSFPLSVLLHQCYIIICNLILCLSAG